MCNVNLYNLDSQNQILFDGIDYWDNKYCKNNTPDQILGSCGNYNKKYCVDFITKDRCEYIRDNGKADEYLGFTLTRNKSDVSWTNKTCQDPVKYVLPNDIDIPTIDRIT
jgi:hypothetical protein